ncbi:MAG: nucleotidyltransferase domain-containing protein [Aristaeellaceae bacterium]
MMFSPDDYLARLTGRLTEAFGPRLVYVGLQGSYLRGEAGPDSDIDAMVVLDRLTPADLDAYRRIIHALEEPEKSCGFICGREDLARWNPLEICHLTHATRDVYGRLADLVPAWDARDLRSFLQLSVGNLYHALCHSRAHGSPEAQATVLAEGCKGAFFILQNLHCLDSGVFADSRRTLLPLLSDADRQILTLRPDDPSAFPTLLGWCQDVLARLAPRA